MWVEFVIMYQRKKVLFFLEAEKFLRHKIISNFTCTAFGEFLSLHSCTRNQWIRLNVVLVLHFKDPKVHFSNIELEYDQGGRCHLGGVSMVTTVPHVECWCKSVQSRIRVPENFGMQITKLNSVNFKHVLLIQVYHSFWELQYDGISSWLIVFIFYPGLATLVKPWSTGFKTNAFSSYLFINPPHLIKWGP